MYLSSIQYICTCQVTSAALGNNNDPYDTLWRAIFWTFIGVVAVTVGAIALATFFIYIDRPVPIILQHPRPQIMMLLVAVPSVAQACAGRFPFRRTSDLLQFLTILLQACTSPSSSRLEEQSLAACTLYCIKHSQLHHNPPHHSSSRGLQRGELTRGAKIISHAC